MVSKNEIEKSKTIAKKTLKKIEQDSLAPTPETYALIYNYFANTNTEIQRGIDIIQKKKGALNEQDCAELFRQHLDPSRMEDIMKKAEEAVFALLNDVSDIVGEIETATGSYDTVLEKSSQALTQVKTIDDLKNVVTAIASHNKKMMEKNKDLEKELTQSTVQLTDLKQEVETVKQEAKTDGLTGLINRRAFDASIKIKMKDAAEEKKAMSLLMLDIDHFKKFNDTYGHQVGDQVLKLVARTLVESIKGKDIAARYGGEEFAIILPETNLTAAVAVANSLRKAVANKELINKNTGDVLGRITISVGAAESVSHEEAPGLIERADQALYSAKEKGRDQVCAAPKPDAFAA